MSSEEVVAEQLDRLRGRLCGFIEACGLPEKQERGAISTLKSLSYDAQRAIIDSLPKT